MLCLWSIVSEVRMICCFQGGLYGTLQSSVNGFRAMVGAPDSPRWNAVLFGGNQFDIVET